MHIPGLRELGVLGFFKKLYKRWSDNAITDRAAQLTYYFVFALFPFLSFLVTLAAGVVAFLAWSRRGGTWPFSR